MGDDWCRMKLKQPQDHSQVEALIIEQALAFRQWGDGFIDDILPLNTEYLATDELKQEARQRYIVASEQLAEVVEIPAFDKALLSHSDEVLTCMRMSFIGRNDIFPGEWRISAYRTYLPHEVSIHLALWENYIKDVQNGKFWPYLLEWYLYRESKHAIHSWADMCEWAETVNNKNNQWAKRIAVTDVPKRILGLTEPETYPIPKWNRYANVTSMPNYKEDIRYLKLRNFVEELSSLRWEWNRVGRGKRLFWVSNISFENYLQGAEDDYLQELFLWLHKCVDDGYGLYLWA